MTSDPVYWTGRAGKGRWGSLPPALYQAQGVFPCVACRPILGKAAKLGRLGACWGHASVQQEDGRVCPTQAEVPWWAGLRQAICLPAGQPSSGVWGSGW